MPVVPEHSARTDTSAASAQDLALFPLGGVLLPGGLLPLRIFEPRYLDLLGHCLRENQAFGVVLITSGTDTDSAVRTAEIGTSARVIDFQPMPDGLLGVLCRGERRFRILQRSQQPNGLNRARVQWLPEPPPVPPAARFAAAVSALRKAIASLINSQRFIEPHYEDAGWVSHRLAELLALEPALLQRLLELDDPEVRLQLLAPLLKQHDLR
ncbi:MAG TPA: LON peptidase substrate-binding domain-containing protein [Steroidobacteraceae bacterium]|nr:LON peptidase substrate-binding domain-containing protein [Steroidobacteraceae bacterium]